MDYTKLYNSIISNRQINPLNKVKGQYSEVHHIVPRCLGGSDNKSNLIRLTAREHFIAHRILSKWYPDNLELALAVLLMMEKKGKRGRKFKVSSKEYERLKKLASQATSDRFRKLWKDPVFRGMMSGENASFYGKKHSDKTKQFLSECKRGENNPNFGKTFSDEYKQKLSASQRDRFRVYEYDIDDPKHFFWERADELMFAISNAGVINANAKILKSVYGTSDRFAVNVCRRISAKISKYGWNPLEDDRWVEYTRKRFELLNR